MTADEIATIRNMRGCGVPWKAVAKEVNHTILECRAAIGMPEYDKPTERRVMPWDVVQQTLPFDQPIREEISER